MGDQNPNTEEWTRCGRNRAAVSRKNEGGAATGPGPPGNTPGSALIPDNLRCHYFRGDCQTSGLRGGQEFKLCWWRALLFSRRNGYNGDCKFGRDYKFRHACSTCQGPQLHIIPPFSPAGSSRPIIHSGRAARPAGGIQARLDMRTPEQSVDLNGLSTSTRKIYTMLSRDNIQNFAL